MITGTNNYGSTGCFAVNTNREDAEKATDPVCWQRLFKNSFFHASSFWVLHQPLSDMPFFFSRFLTHRHQVRPILKQKEIKINISDHRGLWVQKEKCLLQTDWSWKPQGCRIQCDRLTLQQHSGRHSCLAGQLSLWLQHRCCITNKRRLPWSVGLWTRPSSTSGGAHLLRWYQSAGRGTWVSGPTSCWFCSRWSRWCCWEMKRWRVLQPCPQRAF